LASSEDKSLETLRRKRAKLEAEWKSINAAVSAIEWRRGAKARARAMTTAIASNCIFRDGTPRDTPQHREIAQRYAWYAYKSGKTRSWRIEPKKITRIRLRELERIFSSRYGKFLPHNAAGRDALVIAAHHIVHMGPNAEQHIRAWARLWTPWMALKHVVDLARTVIANPVKYKADTLGHRLQLSHEERQRLAITTIGAVGQNAEQRKRLRKHRRRAYDRLRRERKGAKTREEYEAGSLTRTKPWEALGISRRTWYRRGRPK
jgi:hypothetical protein